MAEAELQSIPASDQEELDETYTAIEQGMDRHAAAEGGDEPATLVVPDSVVQAEDLEAMADAGVGGQMMRLPVATTESPPKQQPLQQRLRAATPFRSFGMR